MRISDWSSDVCSSDLLELAARFPIEAAAIDQQAAEGEAVAAEPLGRRVQHQVGAQFDRTAEVRCREGAVDEQRQSGRVRHLGHRRDVEHLEPRIAQALGKDEARLRPDRVAEARSEEHTSELQSLMRISYAVFCLKKKNTIKANIQE